MQPPFLTAGCATGCAIIARFSASVNENFAGVYWPLIMRNLKIVIQYDGSRYLGWQRQKEEDPERPRTIQGKLEQVLSRMTGEKIEVLGACRTDAGVHAEAQVANFLTASTLSLQEVRAYLTRYLPEDIAVTAADQVDARFHARYRARRKRYVYRIWTAPHPPVFQRRYCLHLPEALDLEAMRRAAGLLAGKHDFRSFTTLKTKTKSTVRTLHALEVRERDGWVELHFEAEGFLHNMARILTGTLLEVGAGRLPAEAMESILEARERSAAGPLAPPQGLCLLEVLY
jgi:tRNA pseudouridine38-40 synthase